MNRLLIGVRFGALAGLAVTVGLLAGCSGSARVEGTVKYKGQAVEGALVSFLKEDGEAVASGITDSSGRFQLKTTRGKDALPGGTYKVTVTKVTGTTVDLGKHTDAEGKLDPTAAMKDFMKGKEMKGPPRPGMGIMAGKAKGGEKSLLPETFRDVKTTTLTATVPGGPYDFDLGS